MAAPAQVPAGLDRLGKPFAAYPTIRVFTEPTYFKNNLQQSSFADIADSLAGDMSSFWEQGVWDALKALSASACYAARCVLTEIDWYGKRGRFSVFIVPRNMNFERAYWDTRTDVTPQERAIKMWLNASSKPRQGISGPGMMANASNNRRGAGDNVVLEFDPANWNPDNKFREIANQIVPGQYGPYGTSPAEALLHELVHAMRTIKGLTDLTSTGLPFNDTIEEFVAVLVTNIHTGERNPSGLRAGHRGFMPMSANWTTSEGFLADPNNRRLVKYLCRQDPSFCSNLARTVYVNAFNPIRLLLNPFTTSAL
jgi:hypothetical protein